MTRIDKDTVDYIFNYYTDLFTLNEKAALKHLYSLVKLNIGKADQATDLTEKLYREKGWLSSRQEILDLLKDGKEAFRQKVADRILQQQSNRIYFNYCAGCGRLARTPSAKQCRYCGLDWH